MKKLLLTIALFSVAGLTAMEMDQPNTNKRSFNETDETDSEAELPMDLNPYPKKYKIDPSLEMIPQENNIIAPQPVRPNTINPNPAPRFSYGQLLPILPKRIRIELLNRKLRNEKNILVPQPIRPSRINTANNNAINWNPNNSAFAQCKNSKIQCILPINSNVSIIPKKPVPTIAQLNSTISSKSAAIKRIPLKNIEDILLLNINETDVETINVIKRHFSDEHLGQYPSIENCLIIDKNANIVDSKGNIIAYIRKGILPQEKVKRWTEKFAGIPSDSWDRGHAAGPINQDRLPKIKSGETWKIVDAHSAFKLDKNGNNQNAIKYSNILKSSSIGVAIKHLEKKVKSGEYLKSKTKKQEILLEEEVIPFFEEMSQYMKKIAPLWYEEQESLVKDKTFRLGNAVFTIGTFNLGTPNTSDSYTDSQTGCHRDVNHSNNGYELFAVLGNDIEGGELVYPEYNFAIKLAAGDLIIMKGVRDIHGNAPLIKGQKLSAILYVHKNHGNFTMPIEAETEKMVEDEQPINPLWQWIEIVEGKIQPIPEINPDGDRIVTHGFNIMLQINISNQKPVEISNDQLSESIINDLGIEATNCRTSEKKRYAKNYLTRKIVSRVQENGQLKLIVHVMIDDAIKASQVSEELYGLTINNKLVAGLDEIILINIIDKKNNVPTRIAKSKTNTTMQTVFSKATWLPKRRQEIVGLEDTDQNTNKKNDELRLSCAHCNKTFINNQMVIKKHLGMVHFICVFCQPNHIQFGSKLELNEHRKEKHQGLKPL